MNRRPRRFMTTCAAIALVVSVTGYVEGRKRNISPTARATIDGDTYAVDESETDHFSKAKRELGRMGVELPDGFDFGDGPLVSSNPIFSERVSASPHSSSSKPIDVPSGLGTEHTLSLEGGEMPVKLAFGRIESRGVVISRLESEGWERCTAGKGSDGLIVLSKTGGKETSIVLLDETKDEFLMVREVGGEGKTTPPAGGGRPLDRTCVSRGGAEDVRRRE